MKKKRIILSLISALFVLVFLLLPSFASVAPLASENEYDYSRPGSSHNVTLDSAALLEYAIGLPLLPEESEYLSVHGPLKLSYNGAIPTSSIITEYSDGKLTVLASAYTYVAENGAAVTWTPATAELLGEEKSLISLASGYFAEFTDVTEQDGEKITVTYEASFTINKENLNGILNMAYLDAPRYKAELEEKNREYLRLLEEYDRASASFEDYLKALSEYEAKYAAYTDYLTKKRVYLDALREYEEYLADLREYEDALEEYNSYDERLSAYNEAYADYRQYLSDLVDYEARLAVYEKYLADMAIVSSQLGAVDLAKVPMTLERTAYSAIMGNTVTSVLENKSVITGSAVGASEEAVNRAGEATENLRVLMTHYFSIESEADKYAYYTINYESFRDNFVNLLQSLDKLYSNKRVRGILISEGKNEKYLILVAQLYLISNALTDGKVYSFDGNYAFDSSYRIDGKSVPQILEWKTYYSDTDNSAPISGGYPAAVEEPKAPEEVKEPTKPTPVSTPVKPKEVQNPGKAPDEVKEPTKPDAVLDPGEAPSRPTLEDSIAGIVSAYNSGKLSEREELSSDVSLKLTSTVEKTVFGASSLLLVFRNDFGTELYRAEAEKGGRADFYGEPPVKAEDEIGSYSFIGWSASPETDELYDLNKIDGEDTVYLYPVYQISYKYYEISFSVGDKTTTQKYKYGEAPIYPETPRLDSELGWDYLFGGWDSPLSPVTSDKTYVAEFDKSYWLTYSGGKGARVYVLDGYLVATDISASGGRLELARFIEKAREMGLGFRVESMQATFSASYSTASLMLESGDTSVELHSVQLGSNGYKYYSTVFNETGAPSAKSYKFNVSLPANVISKEHTTLFYEEDGEKTLVKYTALEKGISFTLTTGITYVLKLSYSVSVIPSKLGEVSTDLAVASPGETVCVTYSVPNGVSLERVYLVHSDGTEEEIKGGYFRMPSSDVSVCIETRRIEYTVVFKDGDRVLATYTYYYGDEVIPPLDPSRMNSEMLKYTFIGWSPEISPVTEDRVYSAKYSSELLPMKTEDTGFKASPRVMRLIVAGIVAASMLVVVVIPSGVFTLVLLRKRRRERLPKGHFDKKQQIE